MPRFYSGQLWSRFLATLAILLLCFSGAQSQNATQPPRTIEIDAAKPLHFLAFGDWGTGAQQQKDVAEALARYAQEHASETPVQFVISAGDNFYESGVQSVDDPMWRDKFELMYDAVRLPMPFISVLGNHDWVSDPLAQILYGQRPNTRWQMDGFWFSRRYTRRGETQPLADFFYIDTDLWASDVRRLADKQLQWLRDGLKNSTARWQIVIGHHPLYSNGAHGRDRETIKIRELLAPLFKETGVDAYLSGHDHDLQRILAPEQPTLYLVSGAGGKLRPKSTDDWQPFYASTLGFAALMLSDTELSGQFIDAQGKAIDTFRHAPVRRQPTVAAPQPAVIAPVVQNNALTSATRRVFEAGDTRLDESSGLAASRRYNGWIWTHNDSGDKPRVYLLSPDGKTRATVTLEGASAHDWEDMAVAGQGDNAWVYVADIGDSNGARENVTIYRFRESALPPQSALEAADISPAQSTLALACERMTIVYPNGGKNAESMMAAPSGHIIIASKEAGKTSLWITPRPFAPEATQTLASIGEYAFRFAGQAPSNRNGVSNFATGGDLSPDAKHVALCSYMQAREWALPASISQLLLNEKQDAPSNRNALDGATLAVFAEVWKSEPAIWNLPEMPQCEAICYGIDGRHVFVGSEGLPMTLWELAPPRATEK